MVEGPSELIYLKSFSARLEAEGRTSLREDVTIVPTGGLDKVATFVALLGASGLKLAILHDYRGAPDQRLLDLVRHKMLSPGAVFNVSQFRDLSKIGSSGTSTDIEDLFTPSVYLDCFNKAFSKALGGTSVSETDLPSDHRIVGRIERYLSDHGITTRPSGGFNHYTVASHFAVDPPSSIDADTLTRFEELFKAINAIF